MVKWVVRPNGNGAPYYHETLMGALWDRFLLGWKTTTLKRHKVRVLKRADFRK